MPRAAGVDGRQPAPAGRARAEPGQHGATGAPAPRPREQRRHPVDAAGQRDRRVEGEPEQERTPGILVAKMLEFPRRGPPPRRGYRGRLVQNHQAAPPPAIPPPPPPPPPPPRASPPSPPPS